MFQYFFFNLFNTDNCNFTYFLNKSEQILSNDQINSFLPTIKKKQFNDTFKNFTFFVEIKKTTK